MSLSRRSILQATVRSQSRRNSMALFYYPDYRAVIEPLPPFIDGGNPPHDERIVWGDYLTGQFGRAYAHYREDA